MSEIFKANEPKTSRPIDFAIDESRQLSVFEKKILKTREETEKIVADAKADAMRVVDEAKAQADGIRDKAYKEGLETGKEESLGRLDQLYGSLETEIEIVRKSQTELINSSRNAILDFSFKLTKLILGSEAGKDPSLLESHLNRILDRLTVDATVEITVSSGDYEIIEAYLKDTNFNQASGGYDIKVDPELGRGSIKVNTDTMGIDGTLEGMLNRVEQTVMDLLNEDD